MNLHPSPVPHAIPEFSEMNLALKVAGSVSAGYFVYYTNYDPTQ
jgi:hypothetical protein